MGSKWVCARRQWFYKLSVASLERLSRWWGGRWN